MPVTNPALSPLALSALALLAEGPMHPYEMFQLAVQRRDHRLVKIKPGTLYHAVKRLQKSRLIRVVGTDREGGRPERTTYAITDAGRMVLRDEVAELLGQPVEEYPVFPFALSEAHNLPPVEVTDLLRRRLSALRARLEEIDQGLTIVTGKDLPWAYWLHLDYLQATTAAEIRWIEAALDDIAVGRFAVPAEHGSTHDADPTPRHPTENESTR